MHSVALDRVILQKFGSGFLEIIVTIFLKTNHHKFTIKMILDSIYAFSCTRYSHFVEILDLDLEIVNIF
jgi:flagellar biosynthesis protein FliR